MTHARESDWREAATRAGERRARRAAQTRPRWFVLIGLIALGADQATKALVHARLDLGERHELLPVLAFERTRNTGIAFGLFPGNPGLVTVLTLIAMCAIGVALSTFLRRHLLVLLGGGALVGGALGNLVDRLRHGAVTDFIAVPNFPNFNVADSAITVGVGLVLLGLWKTGEVGSERG